MKDVAARFCDSLKSIAYISAGYPLRTAVDSLPAGDVAVIQMGNVNPDTGVDWETAKRVALPSKRSANFLASGDVIFTTRGTRNFALALGQVPGSVVCSPHFFIMRVHDTSRMSPEFLAWQLNQRPAQEYFRREATGSYILNLRRDVIENLSVGLPPLERQHAIMALADAVRAERATLTKLIENRNNQMEAIALDVHRPNQNPFERPQT